MSLLSTALLGLTIPYIQRVPPSPSLKSRSVKLTIYLNLVQRLEARNYSSISQYFFMVQCARGSVVVEALCYKPEGRGIASR
jgi:hypothetical protein